MTSTNRLLIHVRLLKAPETNTNKSRANQTCLTKYLYCVPPYNVSPRKTTSPAVRVSCYITNTRRSILMMHRSDVISLTSKSHFRRPSRLMGGLPVQTDRTLKQLITAVNLIYYVIHLTRRANKTTYSSEYLLLTSSDDFRHSCGCKACCHWLLHGLKA